MVVSLMSVCMQLTVFDHVQYIYTLLKYPPCGSWEAVKNMRTETIAMNKHDGERSANARFNGVCTFVMVFDSTNISISSVGSKTDLSPAIIHLCR